MKRLRHYFLAWALAAMFAFGQHAAAVHALGHASGELAHHDSTPAPAECKHHALFCSIGGAVAMHVAIAPLVAAAFAPAAVQKLRSASLPPRFSLHSRAPPVSPA